jgi:uncharacterized membrane protein
MAISAQRDDTRIEQWMGNLLRAGVLLSAAVVLVGAGVYLTRHGAERADYRAFRGEPDDLRNPAGIVHGALSGRGRGLIQLGLLILLATPIARVAFSVLAFAGERDYLYVLFTLVVLGVLLFGLFWSPGEGAAAFGSAGHRGFLLVLFNSNFEALVVLVRA